MAYQSSNFATYNVGNEYRETLQSAPVSYLNGASDVPPSSPSQPSVEEIDALRSQANRLSHLLQVMPAGVIVLDGKGIVRQANSQAIDLLGEPLEGELWRTIIARSFNPRADDGHEVSLIDGRRVKLSITPLETEPGQLIVLTDLTETRELQARVSHMQRLSALGKMVASLAHQVRTPLSAAMLYAANLTRKNLPDESRVQFAEKLNARLKDLESQVNDMLLFAKSGDNQVVNTLSLQDIEQLVHANAQTMAEQAGQQLIFEGFEQDSSILGNGPALQGALLNLIHNASQVSPKQGVIRVKAVAVEKAVAISVCDAGPGVPAELQSKIFEPFFTTKSQGTGLGLAVVKSVVSAHKGQLGVNNLAGQGACFTISLPRVPSVDIQDADLLLDAGEK
ncbi:PAS domain-containing protein [Alteromonas aestuariivivens]|uniref:histidine kinase n=1 Tax=Alteromonas aestuariivivens TaxID=1938339 RepID=A0A3D8M691_9ALTE|nr:ATP-binding protein [Alteromonas aestuariivivens]RDV25065.1 PAS domain-containing protein [Alteromonas aestuariivivens]